MATPLPLDVEQQDPDIPGSRPCLTSSGKVSALSQIW
jgi:hypothetical protein